MKNIFKNNSLASCLLGIIIGAGGHAGYTTVIDAITNKSQVIPTISPFGSFPKGDSSKPSVFDQIPEQEDGNCLITPSGQKYHHPDGCRYIAKSKRKKLVYSEDAEAAGLTPCSKCW